MLKKLIIAALCIFPMAAIAQTPKFGQVDMAAVFESMPERNQIQKEMEEMQAKYEAELTKMGDEYQKKVQDFIASQDSLPKNISEARAQEIEQLQQRIQNFREMAARELQNQQQQKIAPLLEKIRKALEQVGQKHGFTYIFDLGANNILYFSPEQTVDVLPLVKAELGIK